MPEASSDFLDLIARARQGDEAAGTAIVEKYGPHVLRVVRRHLAPETRRMLDSGDVEQSVWRSFFAHELADHEFAAEGQLRQFLLRLSRRKTLDANRHYLDSQREDLRRLRSLEELSLATKERLLDARPLPPETAEAKEELERLVASLSPRYRPIVVMLYDGYSHEEIAEEVGCTERTVRRVVWCLRRIY